MIILQKVFLEEKNKELSTNKLTQVSNSLINNNTQIYKKSTKYIKRN